VRFRTCSCEPEIAQAIRDGRWPDACAKELRDHVERCANCSDLVLVTLTFQRARHDLPFDGVPGSANLLWWRAQLRRRNAAAERISKPVTIAQIFAWLVIVVLGMFFAASQYHEGLRWEAWGSSPSRLLHVIAGQSGNWNLLLLIPSCGILILLSGIVVYLSSQKK